MQISVQTAKPLIIHIGSHVLDDVCAYVVDLVNAIDFHETCSPNRLQVGFLQIRQIANHVVMHRTSVVFVLELDNRHVFEIRVSVFQTHHKLAEVLIAGFNVFDVKGHLVIECQRYELGTAIEVTAYQLANAVSACALSVLVVVLGISAVTLTFSAAFGIQFFVSPNLDNAFCDNDFLVVFLRIFSPHFSANSQRIIKSSSGGAEPRARSLAARILALPPLLETLADAHVRRVDFVLAWVNAVVARGQYQLVGIIGCHLYHLSCLCYHHVAHLVDHAHGFIHGHNALSDEVRTECRTAQTHLFTIEVDTACHLGRHSNVNAFLTLCQWHINTLLSWCDTSLPHIHFRVNAPLFHFSVNVSS